MSYGCSFGLEPSSYKEGLACCVLMSRSMHPNKRIITPAHEHMAIDRYIDVEIKKQIHRHRYRMDFNVGKEMDIDIVKDMGIDVGKEMTLDMDVGTERFESTMQRAITPEDEIC